MASSKFYFQLHEAFFHQTIVGKTECLIADKPISGVFHEIFTFKSALIFRKLSVTSNFDFV